MQNLTDLSVLRALCEKYGFSFSKGLGQNFLINPGICPKICDVAGITKDDCVLEIGPGFGTLTRELAARAGRVVSLELDNRLLPVLGETLAGCPNAAVVQGDILKADLATLMAAEFDRPAVVCANLPYYITSPTLMRLLEGRLPIKRIAVMVQKEAAERIAAAPGTRAAGAVSYATHYYSQPALQFTVKPGSFYPPPKVTSAVITLDVLQDTALQTEPEREKRLFRLIRAGFSQRRKTLANALAGGLALQKPQIEAALAKAGIARLARPEQLTLEEYVRLEAALFP